MVPPIKERTPIATGHLKRFFGFFVAALFCLSLSAPQGHADNISIGTGILNLCWNGVSSPCDFPGSQPNVSFTSLDGNDHLSIHVSGNAGTNDLGAPLLLIFATPVENLLYPFFGDPQLNPFAASNTNINAVGLYEDYNPDPNTLPQDPPLPSPDAALGWDLPVAGSVDYLGGGTLFTSQGTIFDPSDYDQSTNPLNNQFFNDFLRVSGVGGGSDTVFTDWAKEMFDTPAYLANHHSLDELLTLLGMTSDEFIANLLGQYNGQGAPCALDGTDSSDDCVTGFKIWIYEVETTADGHAFGSGDTIDVSTSGFPLGTIVTAYGVKADCADLSDTGGCVLAPPDSKIAILMATPGSPPVPEPTSLLLLGAGLAMVGTFGRKRFRNRR